MCNPRHRQGFVTHDLTLIWLPGRVIFAGLGVPQNLIAILYPDIRCPFQSSIIKKN